MRDDDGFAVFAAASARRLRHAARLLTGDDSRAEDTKARYSFPYGDFADVHRCALLSAESRAGQYDHEDVKSAAAHLHGMLEGARAAT